MSYPFFLRWRWHPAAHRLVVDHVDYTDDLRRHRTIRVSQAVYIVIRLVTNVDRTLRSRSFNSVQIHTRLNRRCAIRYQQNSHVLDDHSRSHTRCSLSYEHASRERKKKKRKKKNEHTLVLAVTDIHILIYIYTHSIFFLSFFQVSFLNTSKERFLYPFAILSGNLLLYNPRLSMTLHKTHEFAIGTMARSCFLLSISSRLLITKKLDIVCDDRTKRSTVWRNYNDSFPI